MVSAACRERLRANPSLVNCCTIDWLGPPPADALEAVANKQLSELPNMDADTRKTLVGLCQAIHVQVRGLYIQYALSKCVHSALCASAAAYQSSPP